LFFVDKGPTNGALEELPAQAMRYVRWYQSLVEAANRRSALPSALASRRDFRSIPKRLRLEVHDLLWECRLLVLNPPERKRARPAFLSVRSVM
jgi:hypothetical protein